MSVSDDRPVFQDFFSVLFVSHRVGDKFQKRSVMHPRFVDHPIQVTNRVFSRVVRSTLHQDMSNKNVMKLGKFPVATGNHGSSEGGVMFSVHHRGNLAVKVLCPDILYLLCGVPRQDIFSEETRCRFRIFPWLPL